MYTINEIYIYNSISDVLTCRKKTHAKREFTKRLENWDKKLSHTHFRTRLCSIIKTHDNIRHCSSICMLNTFFRYRHLDVSPRVSPETWHTYFTGARGDDFFVYTCSSSLLATLHMCRISVGKLEINVPVFKCRLNTRQRCVPFSSLNLYIVSLYMCVLNRVTRCTLINPL